MPQIRQIRPPKTTSVYSLPPKKVGNSKPRLMTQMAKHGSFVAGAEMVTKSRKKGKRGETVKIKKN